MLCIFVRMYSKINLFCEAQSVSENTTFRGLLKYYLLFLSDKPTDISFTSDKVIALTCNAKGNPKPHYQIVFNGTILEDSEDGMVIIKNVNYVDNGTYVCVARNNQGELRTSINVATGEKPLTSEPTTIPNTTITITGKGNVHVLYSVLWNIVCLTHDQFPLKFFLNTVWSGLFLIRGEKWWTCMRVTLADLEKIWSEFLCEIHRGYNGKMEIYLHSTFNFQVNYSF